MDEEFGVGDLVSESFQEEKRRVSASVEQACIYKASGSLTVPLSRHTPPVTCKV